MAKIFYESKLAKLLTFLPHFATMMFFGVVITEEKEEDVDQETKNHETTHIRQYWDYFWIGLAIAVVTAGILLACKVFSFHLLWLLLVPPVHFYLWYGIEILVQLIKGYNLDRSYERVSFEREAYSHEDEDGYNEIRGFMWNLRYL